MSDALVATLVTAGTGVVVAVVTGLLGYRSARWQQRRELEVELRSQRLAAFKKLWALSEPLARYGFSATERQTYASMTALSIALRHWYFSEGGMFLSDTSRDAYFAFQQAIEDAVAAAPDAEAELDPEARERLRQKGRLLRTTLRASFKGFPQM
ncbi:hypothetical protein GCM10027446_03150 [Angustibacter peucedani]